MTGKTERSPSGWTIDTLAVHHAALREADVRLEEEREKRLQERDRRYTEVKQAEEKALKIKEEADRTALGLQRDNQQYRDEKGNELRSQIERERGSYATKDDLTAAVEKIEVAMKPLSDFVTLQQGRQSGIGLSAGVIVASITAVAASLGIVIVIANVLTGR